MLILIYKQTPKNYAQMPSKTHFLLYYSFLWTYLNQTMRDYLVLSKAFNKYCIESSSTIN